MFTYSSDFSSSSTQLDLRFLIRSGLDGAEALYIYLGQMFRKLSVAPFYCTSIVHPLQMFYLLNSGTIVGLSPTMIQLETWYGKKCARKECLLEYRFKTRIVNQYFNENAYIVIPQNSLLASKLIVVRRYLMLPWQAAMSKNRTQNVWKRSLPLTSLVLLILSIATGLAG